MNSINHDNLAETQEIIEIKSDLTVANALDNTISTEDTNLLEENEQEGDDSSEDIVDEISQIDDLSDEYEDKILEPDKVQDEVSPWVSKLNNAVCKLLEVGLKSEADQLRIICEDVLRSKFVVSVVGEFNRGKSTFINNLLEREILPVGNLPTTALLTRIIYAPRDKEAIEHIDGQGRILESKTDITPKSWSGLVAENFGGKDPAGSAIVKLDNEWLRKHNIELIDAPGAGDLNDNRARQIGEALMRSDGAIIAVDANQALSLTEKIFIEQRVVSRRVPFLMMIITKLDLVGIKERNQVIDYIEKKLKLWNLYDKISLCIPNDIEMPDETYNYIKGLDKVRSTITSWINCPDRTVLTDSWLKSRVVEIINNSKSLVKEQLDLLNIDDERCETIISEKKQSLSKSELYWNELCLELRKRENDCLEKFDTIVKNGISSIPERLQHEAVNAQNPGKWWEDSYSYRLKIELGNWSASLSNFISQIALNDARWISQELQKSFNVAVSDAAVRNNPGEKCNTESQATIELKNVNNTADFIRLGVVALGGTIGTLILTAFEVSFFPIVLTIGIGASIFARNFSRRRTREQQNLLKEAIATDIKNVVREATSESEVRIKQIYQAILKEAEDKKLFWLHAQEIAIEDSCRPKTQERRDQLSTKFSCLKNISLQFS